MKRLLSLRMKTTSQKEYLQKYRELRISLFLPSKNNHSGVIEELIALYIKLAETFSEQMVKYTAEEASKERRSYFGIWKEADWLSSDIRELCDRAIASHDKDIIQQVVYLPVDIARQAIEKNNHYLFQEFMLFTESLYRYARKEQDKELKKFLIDCSWRHLKETARFSIEPKLMRDDLKPQEAESLKDFGIYLLPCFQNLLKQAYDNRDLESFKTFRQETKKLFEHLSPNIGDMMEGKKDQNVFWFGKLDTGRDYFKKYKRSRRD